MNTGNFYKPIHRARQRFPAKFSGKPNTKTNHIRNFDTKTSSTPIP